MLRPARALLLPLLLVPLLLAGCDPAFWNLLRVEATAVAPGEVRLDWRGAVFVTGYEIGRHEDGGFADLASLAAGETTYADAEIAAAGIHLYRVTPLHRLFLFFGPIVRGLPSFALVRTFDPALVLVVAPHAPDPLRGRMLGGLAGYLEQLTGEAPGTERPRHALSLAALEARAAASASELVLVLDADTVVPEAVPPEEIEALERDTLDGFRIAVEERPAATLLLLAGGTRLARQYAMYEALRRLGARFYHPEEEYVPRVPRAQLRARAATPTVLGPGPDYAPDFRHRAYTFHGAHPLEHLEAFSDSAHPIDEAVRVNDWIVKNRGDQLRGAGRGIAPAASRDQRAAELEALRQVLGMRRSVGITLHATQQGSRPDIDRDSPIPVRDQIEALVDERLAAAPDAVHFGIHFGPTEVTTTPDEETVQWLDWAGQRALSVRPDLPVIINDHTSGGQAVEHFGDLGCPPGTNDDGVADYYDLAFHTDPRIGVQVHTVMFYPLEGPARVYNQKSFAHKLCLMELGSSQGRPLVWFPESSWWLSFDNPVPAYLPLYLGTRRRDIELVTPLLASRGAGTVYFHKQFNSGHEWGYWQQDYGVGLWHWNVDVSLDDVLGELTDPLCAPEVWPASCLARNVTRGVLGLAIAAQEQLFLEAVDHAGRPGGIYPYFAGEDAGDELSALAGFEFRPVRVPFRSVIGWSNAEVARFRDRDLARLAQARDQHRGWVTLLRSIEAFVPPAGRPWLAEIVDGLEINALRAEQTLQLYEAALAFRGGQRAGHADPLALAQPWLDDEAATRAAAEAVIRRREAAYRYPPAQTHGGGLTPETAVDNGTTYPYRVHTKTHLLTYWEKRRSDVMAALEGAADDPSRVRLEPVFADPGTPLLLGWPDLPGLAVDVALGDGTRATDPATPEHVYPGGDAVYLVSGAIESDGLPIPIEGAVARTARRALTPAGGFALVEPDNPLVVDTIRGVMPAFHWALGDARLALAVDPLGDGGFGFDEVVTAEIDLAPDGSFAAAPLDLRVPLAGSLGADSGLTVQLRGAVFSGQLDAAGDLAGPLQLDAELELEGVIRLLIELAGFDRGGAINLLAALLGFDPADPPERLLFLGELALEPPL